MAVVTTNLWRSTIWGSLVCRSSTKVSTCKLPQSILEPMYRDKVVENTDRISPNVPKLSDDRGCLDRNCQSGDGGDTSKTADDRDRSL